jgi:hypothetical protein
VRANQIAPHNTAIGFTLAAAYFRAGDLPNAVLVFQETAQICGGAMDLGSLGYAYWRHSNANPIRQP